MPQGPQGTRCCDETGVRRVELPFHVPGELLGSLEDKSVGGIGRIYLERKKERRRKEMFCYIAETSFFRII